MEMMELQKEIHKTAKAKGWWEKERSPLEIYALVHSEISEAVEEARKDTPPIYKQVEIRYRDHDEVETKTPNDVEWNNEFWDKRKHEGEAIELADAIIRILDYAEYKGWDMEKIIMMKHEYNKTRSYRHGGKKY